MCGIWVLLSKIQIKNYDKYFKNYMKIKNRGPEFSNFQLIGNNLILGFHRLAIMDRSYMGNQPFFLVRPDGTVIYLICNGEIYNYKNLIKKYNFQSKIKSKSDCEIILYLYDQFGIQSIVQNLDGEYAFIICEISPNQNKKIYAGRDQIGVRPLFFGLNNQEFCLSSEAKGLTDLYSQVFVFPPGNYLEINSEDFDYKLTKFYEFPQINPISTDIYSKIQEIFIKSVQKRLMSDRDFGCLLSGGLDSSLVCAVTRKILNMPKFPVFTISFPGGTDLPFAKQVAEFLDLEHIIIEIDPETALEAIDETIYAIESFDITSIRASCLQFLVAKKIKETQVRVLLCGENSDELFQGYKYFHNQKNSMDGHLESMRLIQDVHLFDGLRTDRTMAYFGLEIRLPFTDTDLINFVLSLDPELVKPQNKIEKYILRKSFENLKILPDSVLFRSKEALSDGISNLQKSWFEYIQEYINLKISDQEYLENKNKFSHVKPISKESFYYRKKFVEYFGESEQISKLIPYYWLPKWSEHATDPSARTLSVYKN